MTTHTTHYEEHVLVIPRTLLFAQEIWQGLKQTDLLTYMSLIQEHKMFIPRSRAEYDPSYKQIIPYMIFIYRDSLFVMQRKEDASEKRLRNKYSIGIGGHIRQEDMAAGDTIFDWATREFNEEVSYTGAPSISPLGILNDDSDSVGQVHLGLVLIINGNSPDITIRSELKSGHLVPLDQCIAYKDRMESWSKTILEELCNRTSLRAHQEIGALQYQ